MAQYSNSDADLDTVYDRIPSNGPYPTCDQEGSHPSHLIGRKTMGRVENGMDAYFHLCVYRENQTNLPITVHISQRDTLSAIALSVASKSQDLAGNWLKPKVDILNSEGSSCPIRVDPHLLSLNGAESTVADEDCAKDRSAYHPDCSYSLSNINPIIAPLFHTLDYHLSSKIFNEFRQSRDSMVLQSIGWGRNHHDIYTFKNVPWEKRIYGLDPDLMLSLLVEDEPNDKGIRQARDKLKSPEFIHDVFGGNSQFI